MIYEVIGWIGVVFILLAYFLISNKTVTATSKIFHLINLLGAFGVFVNNFVHKAFPSATMNLVWAGIAIWGLWNAVRNNVKK